MRAESTPYINIHGHSQAPGDHEWVLRNLMPEEAGTLENTAGCFSVGLHPWHIESADQEGMLEQVRRASAHPRILAIGEIGLDKSISTPLKRQEMVFLRQVAIAEASGLPLILHVVRAYSEILSFMKSARPGVPVILHGYSGSLQMTRDLLQTGCCFSFGEALLQDRPKVVGAFNAVPEDRLFLERDQAGIDIRELYQQAAAIKGWTDEHMRELVWQNTRTTFPKFRTCE